MMMCRRRFHPVLSAASDWEAEGAAGYYHRAPESPTTRFYSRHTTPALLTQDEQTNRVLRLTGQPGDTSWTTAQSIQSSPPLLHSMT